ncbi:MAG: bifunctional glycosyltransferase/class I SAM-dependent methyltransferase [Acidobacteriota bacterium]|nr:bifunctional glycosyltransferase/class I SAM-dependent methyltransferase [Acidobacteriota bacterium]
MPRQTLSILIPLYNEEEFIRELLRRVAAVPLPGELDREIIVVDDCSTDDSAAEVEAFQAARPEFRIRLIRQHKNRGKGAAIRTALAAATGHYSVIQDADLEYDPREYPKLLAPLLSGEADVVYGSRFLAGGERRVLYFWHSLANRILTTLCNIAADLNLTDMETCYKAFRTGLAKTIPIESDRFGIEPELTVKFARRKARIFETPIGYHGRTYEEGKKIGAKDACEALWVILRARFTSRLYVDAGHSTLDALSYAPRFNKWMADTLRPYMGSSAVEIGAGMGNMTRHLSRGRKLYVATDIDNDHIEHLGNMFRHRPAVCVRKLDVTRAADFAAFAAEFGGEVAETGGEMDTAVCLNVLEHIENEASALLAIRGVLRPGGRLILLVPNDPAAYGTIDREIGHFRRYTAQSLRDVLTGAGYTVDEILNFNRISMPAWRFTGQLMKARTLSRLALRLFDRMVWLWRRIDPVLPWQPTSIVAIARRTD